MATILRRGPRRQSLERVAPPVPRATVLVRPEAIRSIGTASADAGELETGGPLLGTIQRSWEPSGERLIVSMLGTVSPGPGMRAKVSSVGLGRRADGERAASAVRWWRSVTGMDLVHVGDWHKHPCGSPEPSAGDGRTARRMLAETAAPVWLVAIAVGDDRRAEDIVTNGNLARLSSHSDSCQEVRLYREVGRWELARVSIRVEAAALPRLPRLPWHVADPTRFAAECRLLDAAGFTTEIGPADTSNGLALRVRRNGRCVTIVTGAGYPEQRPKVLAEDGRPLDGGAWSPDRFLADLMRKEC